ncbi:SusD-like starch-binding protein associating with outer membrane [Chitinophaga niastensis]|uniref:SusD-like starch-binding protein associating with outer membrane n=1 Tax=Chitinophaga niastensis TaxID=536980 RepID=A0A2P8HGS3_CHINA|nr:RagB/SusD family nutrient uptake outer membrane protein [Chitinophaga niastensis]PSL45413.1 SusD-like starch-binding protein associating with outer membrane [Chitinophaga niastensis]
MKFIINIPFRCGRQLLVCLTLMVLMPSCKKFVAFDPPPTFTTDDKVFNNDKSATAAMLAVYIGMMNDRYGSNGSFVCFSMTALGSMSANELVWTQNNTTAPTFQQFGDHALTPDNTYVHAFWLDGYNYIYQINAILEGLQKSTGVSAGVKQQLEGEARFMRAFCYFYLVNLFGDVPLVLTTAYQGNMILPRTSSDKVWQQIIDDLTAAKGMLTTTYPTAERLRPNRWTASALLARTYLYTGKWPEAEAAANGIIASGDYATTLPALNTVFLKGSTEAIWQLQPVQASANTLEGAQFIVTGVTQPNYEFTPQLLSAFEPGDQRKIEWIGYSDPANPAWAYPSKYKAGAGSVTEYYMVFRLTEQYMIRAEACARQGGAKLPQALADLNVIRKRAGVLLSAITDKDALLLAIEHERQVEFFAEWGHRWFDLKRTGRAEAILKPLSPPGNWKPGSVLYPIPSSEISADPKLTQNDAYAK